MRDDLVRAEDVSKSYPDGRGRRQVFKDISMEIGLSQIVAIQGPSGSGKTTLLNIIAGLLPHDEGRAILFGQDLNYTNPRHVAKLRRQYVGIISQAYGLLHGDSIFTNVELPLVFDRPRLPRASRRVAVQRALEWAELDTDAKTTVTNLSQGEKQRVAIARALVRRPRILVADEPTSALDAATGARIVRRFRTIADTGVAILIATHDPLVAAACDTVFTLEGMNLKRHNDREGDS